MGQWLSHPDRRVISVVDGSRFTDLPDRLREAGLAHASPYKRSTNYSLTLAGPWIVDVTEPALRTTLQSNERFSNPDDDHEALASRLANEALAAMEAGDDTGGGMFPSPPSTELTLTQIGALLSVMANPSWGVFWCGGASLDVATMQRHLRRIHHVEVPLDYVDDAVLGADSIETDDAQSDRCVCVLRHADGNVLAQLLPALASEQFAQVLGPADAIVFASRDLTEADGFRVFTARRPEGARDHPGNVRLDVSTLRRMEAYRIATLADDVALDLHENWDGLAPPFERELDPAFARDVRIAVREADDMGVRTYDAYRDWAELRYDYGDIVALPQVTDFVRNGDGRPEEGTAELIAYRIAYLKERWRNDLERHGTLDALSNVAA